MDFLIMLCLLVVLAMVVWWVAFSMGKPAESYMFISGAVLQVMMVHPGMNCIMLTDVSPNQLPRRLRKALLKNHFNYKDIAPYLPEDISVCFRNSVNESFRTKTVVKTFEISGRFFTHRCSVFVDPKEVYHA